MAQVSLEAAMDDGQVSRWPRQRCRAPADLVLLAAAVLDLMPPAVAVLDLVPSLALDLACYRERERERDRSGGER
jgi:hypothetical protein